MNENLETLDVGLLVLRVMKDRLEGVVTSEAHGELTRRGYTFYPASEALRTRAMYARNSFTTGCYVTEKIELRLA